MAVNHIEQANIHIPNATNFYCDCGWTLAAWYNDVAVCLWLLQLRTQRSAYVSTLPNGNPNHTLTLT